MMRFNVFVRVFPFYLVCAPSAPPCLDNQMTVTDLKIICSEWLIPISQYDDSDTTQFRQALTLAIVQSNQNKYLRDALNVHADNEKAKKDKDKADKAKADKAKANQDKQAKANKRKKSLLNERKKSSFNEQKKKKKG